MYKRQELADETSGVSSWWREDLVSFLIGCSFTFEAALMEAGVPVAHVDQGVNVPMYRTSRRCRPAGTGRIDTTRGPETAPAEQVADAVAVTSRYPAVHGAPVHVGDPAALGIEDLDKPDYGDAVEIRPGEVPVFWACGVTPQAAVVESRPPLAIAHAPGHMLITDARDSDYLLESLSARVAAGSTSSTSTPPASLGCTKLIRLSAVPRRGSSYSSRRPRSRRIADTWSRSVTR